MMRWSCAGLRRSLPCRVSCHSASCREAPAASTAWSGEKKTAPHRQPQEQQKHATSLSDRAQLNGFLRHPQTLLQVEVACGTDQQATSCESGSRKLRTSEKVERPAASKSQALLAKSLQYVKGELGGKSTLGHSLEQSRSFEGTVPHDSAHVGQYVCVCVNICIQREREREREREGERERERARESERASQVSVYTSICVSRHSCVDIHVFHSS